MGGPPPTPKEYIKNGPKVRFVVKEKKKTLEWIPA